MLKGDLLHLPNIPRNCGDSSDVTVISNGSCPFKQFSIPFLWWNNFFFIFSTMESDTIVNYEYFCVLDFEAVYDGNRYGVTDFPVVLVSVKEGTQVDFFHRFVRPHHIQQTLVDSYVNKKYGAMGLAEVGMIYRELIHRNTSRKQSHLCKPLMSFKSG
jgi:hypothetical protein